MDSIISQDVHASQLRAELKAWEKQFAETHGGRKASREDIKADPAIALKYKEFSKLRKPHDADVLKQAGPRTPRRKSSRSQSEQRRGKVEKIQETQITEPQTQNVIQGEDQENLECTPRAPRVMTIGPTPQKNGMPIGLFDSVPSSTPRRPPRGILGEVSINITQTPSKHITLGEDEMLNTGHRFSRTPPSSGKRFMLDAFATPLKRRFEDAGTPSSSKRIVTPAFLKRNSDVDVAAEDSQLPPMQTWPRRSFGRSLSSMIQDRRRQQEEAEAEAEKRAQEKKREEALDEELELLRELEAEAEAEAAKGGGASDIAPSSQTVVAAQRPSAFEDAGWGSDDDGALQQQEREAEAAQTGPVYRKKGQKRQTKRVIMRPSVPSAELRKELRKPSGLDAEYSDGQEGVDVKVKEKKNKQAHGTDGAGGGGRKINPNATSHANFRSLKIKNKNSKAKGRGRRR